LGSHPSGKLADAILLFVGKPDDAEAAAGDVFEGLEKIGTRHGRWYCDVWFTRELTLLVIAKGRKRLFRPVFDLIKRKSL